MDDLHARIRLLVEKAAQDSILLDETKRELTESELRLHDEKQRADDAVAKAAEETTRADKAEATITELSMMRRRTDEGAGGVEDQATSSSVVEEAVATAVNAVTEKYTKRCDEINAIYKKSLVDLEKKYETRIDDANIRVDKAEVFQVAVVLFFFMVPTNTFFPIDRGQ